MRGPLAALSLSLIFALPALADGTPGRFDFYVLSLTWEPSYCDNTAHPDPAQCDSGNEGFVVHGLWPQYEHGYPLSCGPSERLPQSTIAEIADLMPSRGLAQHEWDVHGTCSGLRPESYFALVRRALSAVVIPDGYRRLNDDLATTGDEIENQFILANRGLSGRGIAVTCSREGVIDVRLCLTRELSFRRCPEVDADHCRRPAITLPAAAAPRP